MYQTDPSDSENTDVEADDHTTRRHDHTTQRYDGDDHTLLRAVVEAVATETGRRPIELDPLYDALDTEALERVVSPGGDATPPAGRLRFRYESCDVTVTGDGRVIAAYRESEVR
ncbi:HalOD1 output domain-containing protein [Halosimplex sp. TS25]|uniref:HalOD1 output domain-containing protein n=1 Tax=Halosimplex rarum TaxID=3396619 RepID=UPI0039ECEBAE